MKYESRSQDPVASRIDPIIFDGGPSGKTFLCPECKEHSYRRDGSMDHKEVEESISIDELKDLLST